MEANDDDAFLMKRAWQRAGVANPLQVLSTTKEAKDYLDGRGIFAERKTFPLPCVMITDLRLHGDDALLLVQWIRNHAQVKTLVIVILSGSKYEADIKRAYLLGVNSFLTKPTIHEELADLVGLIRDYWLKANQNPPQCEDKER